MWKGHFLQYDEIGYEDVRYELEEVKFDTYINICITINLYNIIFLVYTFKRTTLYVSGKFNTPEARIILFLGTLIFLHHFASGCRLVRRGFLRGPTVKRQIEFENEIVEHEPRNRVVSDGILFISFFTKQPSI